MRVGLSSISFPDLTLVQFLEYAKKLKVSGAALESRLVENREGIDGEKIGELCAAAGLEETAVVWKGGGEALSDKIDTYFDLCKRVGARILSVEAPGNTSAEDLITLFTDLVKRAEDAGLRLALDSSLPLGIDGVGEIVESIDSDTFGLSFDLGNCARLGENPVTFASFLGKYVHLAVVKDLRPAAGADRSSLGCVPLGKGEISLPEVVKEMSLMGFEGTYCIEIDQLHPEYGDKKSVIRDSSRYMHKLLRKMK